MTDAELDALLRDAARTYNPPPPLDHADALWDAIDRALPAPNAAAGAARPALTVVRDADAARRRRSLAPWTNPWLRAAAVLLLGIAIGRLTARRTPAGATTTVASARPAAPDSVSSAGVSTSDVSTSDVSTVDLPAPVRVATSEYLGRAQALLAALPAQLHARRADPAYLSRADDLLLQTRLLLDSPAATDPALRALFDDLEMVLAQVVRLPRDHDALRVELLNQSLEQRDVLPRLRDAVADTTD